MDSENLHINFFSTERTLNHLSFDLLGLRSLPCRGLKFGYSFETHYYFIALLHWLPRWQTRCCQVSRDSIKLKLLCFKLLKL